MVKINKNQPDWSSFVNYLYSLENEEVAKNRAALATFRKALSKIPDYDFRLFPYVYPKIIYLTEQFKPKIKEIERTAFTLAPLFGLWKMGSSSSIYDNGNKTNYGNFGDSFAGIVNEKSKNADSVEARFIALLNCHKDDLGQHLKHAISLMKSASTENNIDINWYNLARDIYYWSYPQKRVQEKWARSFWTRLSKIKSKENNE